MKVIDKRTKKNNENYKEEVAEDLKKSYNHVEKVNAYIVITD